MQIMKIDPDKKYVLAMPAPNKREGLELSRAIQDFRESDERILIIFGTEVVIIPADQVVGYIPFEDGAQ